MIPILRNGALKFKLALKVGAKSKLSYSKCQTFEIRYFECPGCTIWIPHFVSLMKWKWTPMLSMPWS